LYAILPGEDLGIEVLSQVWSIGTDLIH
jgi:hypothetical protein